ncbi:MAG: molybdopterin-binding protein, partial [Chloroflexota bacterium]|nr:molybdopterin-binding protein [Chloroflexota bacterium]
MSAEEHRQKATTQGSVELAIVTVSDTRTPDTDSSGQLIRSLAEAAGHIIVDYRIVKDEPEQVAQALADFAGGTARLILFNGGTGISARDRTYDVISRALE